MTEPMLNLSATGRPERTGNPSYTTQILLVVGSGFPTGVGRPALGRPEGAGNLSYRAHVLLVQGSGFPRQSVVRPSDVRRKPDVRGTGSVFR